MFKDTDSWEILKLLAAILHLGNVDFKSKDSYVETFFNATSIAPFCQPAVIFCFISGTIVKNLEGSEILKSSHFNMASQLLEAGVVVLCK